MYSEELQFFLESRQRIIESDELKEVIDLSKNPQLKRIVFNSGNNTYDMWDDKGNWFHFTALEFGEKRTDEVIRKLKKL